MAYVYKVLTNDDIDYIISKLQHAFFLGMGCFMP